ncbi:MAG: DUF1425 domain-containing protein [Phycisphaerae bacterium]|nr:DUF1425 domain-containing protein [Phycisphaerae bacterium]
MMNRSVSSRVRDLHTSGMGGSGAGLRMAMFLGAVLLAVGLAGCGPIVPIQDNMNPYPQVELTNWNLLGKIVVREPSASRVGDGQLHIVVPLRNLTDHELYLEYQYRFLNAKGVQVEHTSGWNTVRVQAHGMTQIHFTSLTALANDFNVDIRPLQ